MRVARSVGLLVLAVAGLCLGQDAAQLQGVKTVYVDSLGDDKSAASIRTGIVEQLTKSGRFEVVESADKADGVLSGAGSASRIVEATAKGKGKRGHYHATATVQLKSKDQTVLWSKDAENDSVSHKLSTEDLGHKIAKSLVKDSTPKKK